MTKDVSTNGIPLNQYWLKKKEKCFRNCKAVRSTEEVQNLSVQGRGGGPTVSPLLHHRQVFIQRVLTVYDQYPEVFRKR